MSLKSKTGKYLDRLTGSGSTKFIINQVIRDYGQLTEFRINQQDKIISAAILLTGEDRPIKVTIRKYSLAVKDNSTSLLIEDAESDRPWLTAILKKYVINRPWTIPEEGAEFLKDLLE